MYLLINLKNKLDSLTLNSLHSRPFLLSLHLSPITHDYFKDTWESIQFRWYKGRMEKKPPFKCSISKASPAVFQRCDGCC